MARRWWMVVALVVVGALYMSPASANPDGVPVENPGPLSCTTSQGNWLITALPGAFGEFPVPLTSCSLAANSGKRCWRYTYNFQRITSGNDIADNVVWAISADQDLDAAAPTPFTVQPPGTALGDTATGFLAYAAHEYPLRFNNVPEAVAGSPSMTIDIVGPVAARITTVRVRRGNTSESCLIKGPGVLGDRFQASTTDQTVEAAGGKCSPTITRDSFGKILNINPGPGCVDARPETLVGPGGQPITNNDNITIGTGTTTCWGPKNPTPAWCVCTALPCP